MRIPEPPTGLNDLLSGGAGTGETLLKLMAPAVVEAVRQINEKYLHWDKVKYHPVPEGLDSRELWQAVKLARRAADASPHLQPTGPLSPPGIPAEPPGLDTPHRHRGGRGTRSCRTSASL
jgi:hypothetical protein